MIDAKCSGVMKSGKQCECVAKFTVDGKQYCGRHVKLSETFPARSGVHRSLTLERLHSLPLPQDHEVTSSPKSYQETRPNIFALTLFKWLIGVLWRLYYRFGILICLIVIVCAMHTSCKAYYYKHCDSTLLRVWLFKSSKLCTTLGDTIKVMETWSTLNTNQIFEYIITLFHNSSYFKLVTDLIAS